MRYYKIIVNNNSIEIATSMELRQYNPGSGLFLSCGPTEAEFISVNNKKYRDAWMRPLPDIQVAYEEATITEISEEEYIQLQKLNQEDPAIREEQIQQYIPQEEEVLYNLTTSDEQNNKETLEAIKNQKIRILSAACKNTIENGFDLRLRDDTYHFSLDTQDQLNLITLSTMAQTEDFIPYHADGETCIFYTANEINEIVAAANKFKVYQTTYYNSLKNYVNALDNVDDITAIEYGTPIPDAYKSDVLKAIEV